MEVRLLHFTQGDTLWCQLMVISHMYFTKSIATIIKTIPSDEIENYFKNLMK